MADEEEGGGDGHLLPPTSAGPNEDAEAALRDFMQQMRDRWTCCLEWPSTAAIGSASSTRTRQLLWQLCAEVRSLRLDIEWYWYQSSLPVRLKGCPTSVVLATVEGLAAGARAKKPVELEVHEWKQEPSEDEDVLAVLTTLLQVPLGSGGSLQLSTAAHALCSPQRLKIEQAAVDVLQRNEGFGVLGLRQLELPRVQTVQCEFIFADHAGMGFRYEGSVLFYAFTDKFTGHETAEDFLHILTLLPAWHAVNLYIVIPVLVPDSDDPRSTCLSQQLLKELAGVDCLEVPSAYRRLVQLFQSHRHQGFMFYFCPGSDVDMAVACMRRAQHLFGANLVFMHGDFPESTLQAIIPHVKTLRAVGIHLLAMSHVPRDSCSAALEQLYWENLVIKSNAFENFALDPDSQQWMNEVLTRNQLLPQQALALAAVSRQSSISELCLAAEALGGSAAFAAKLMQWLYVMESDEMERQVRLVCETGSIKSIRSCCIKLGTCAQANTAVALVPEGLASDSLDAVSYAIAGAHDGEQGQQDGEASDKAVEDGVEDEGLQRAVAESTEEAVAAYNDQVLRAMRASLEEQPAPAGPLWLDDSRTCVRLELNRCGGDLARQVRDLLLTAPELESQRQRVLAAGCQMQPEWAHGSVLFVPLTEAMFLEAGPHRREGKRYIFALPDDQEAIAAALKPISKKYRPQVKGPDKSNGDHQTTAQEVAASAAGSASASACAVAATEATVGLELSDTCHSEIEIIEKGTFLELRLRSPSPVTSAAEGSKSAPGDLTSLRGVD